MITESLILNIACIAVIPILIRFGWKKCLHAIDSNRQSVFYRLLEAQKLYSDTLAALDASKMKKKATIREVDQMINDAVLSIQERRDKSALDMKNVSKGMIEKSDMILTNKSKEARNEFCKEIVAKSLEVIKNRLSRQENDSELTEQGVQILIEKLDKNSFH